MIVRDKLPYTVPAILQSVSFSLEGDLLEGSVVDKLNKGGVYTEHQEVEEKSFDNSAEYNFKWE